MSALIAQGLHVRRGAREVLRDVTLDLPAGSITALLGPNGGGKTTLMRVLAGILPPHAGTLRAGDRHAAGSIAWRQQVVLVPTGGAVMTSEDARAHFTFGARAYPAWDAGRALEAAAALHVPLDRRAGTLSTGQRMGLALACAFGCGASVLLLDEPGNGLDPEHRDRLSAAVATFAADGGTVLLSSHVLPEVEGLADRAVFLKAGEIRLAADLDDLRAASSTLQVVLPDVLPARALDELRQVEGVRDLSLEGRTLHVHLGGPADGFLAALSPLRPLDVQARPCPLSRTYADLMNDRGAA